MNDPHLTLARLRLARTPGVGPRTARLLEERLGPPTRILGATRAKLVDAGVPARIASALTRAGADADARAELERHRALGHGVVPLGDERFPARLAAIHDPPQLLSTLGTFPSSGDVRAVAVVGARRATPLGREIAHELGAGLAAAGVVVVSGLARGIDTSAHQGALSTGGRTLAVLAGGLQHVYPHRNRALAGRIVASGGALLSEMPPHQPPRRFDFPRRNRIVTGLSLGVVVVEAGPRSGALISAEFALQQGRELFAVPGSIRQPLAQGTNQLIRDGAHLVERTEDVLDVLFGVS